MKKVKLYFDGFETDAKLPVCVGGMSLDYAKIHPDEKGLYKDYVTNVIFSAPDDLNPDHLIGMTPSAIREYVDVRVSIEKKDAIAYLLKRRTK